MLREGGAAGAAGLRPLILHTFRNRFWCLQLPTMTKAKKEDDGGTIIEW